MSIPLTKKIEDKSKTSCEYLGLNKDVDDITPLEYYLNEKQDTLLFVDEGRNVKRLNNDFVKYNVNTNEIISKKPKKYKVYLLPENIETSSFLKTRTKEWLNKLSKK